VERLVADALAKGAELVCGGSRSGGFYEPTVLARCDHSMAIMTDEIFGPVIPIQKVRSEDEAVTLANRSHLGLAAYVFGKDKARARRVAARIEAGSVMINEVLVSYVSAEAPFGGMKHSGYGRVHGDEALRAMCHEKHVQEARLRLSMMGFPYTEKGYRLLRRGLSLLFEKRLADLL
jgi:succinate-semialdehyde dehydrogenase/glutarate-semialdehyde dehydrogenase